MSKPIFVILGALCLLSSCKDPVDPLIANKKIAKLEITTFTPLGIRPRKEAYLFEYDQQGRLAKLNDKYFYYGNSGKVKFTRKYVKSSTTIGLSYVQENIERVEYQWDNIGRLVNAVLDSLYSKTTHTSEMIGPNPSESIVRHIPLASFSYNGSSSLPSKVSYGHIEDILRDPATGYVPPLYREFQYEGTNVLKEISTAKVPLLGGRWTPVGDMFAFYQYSGILNPLYDVFQQLGFNPLDHSQIVSEHLPDISYTEFQQSGYTGTPKPDWSNATKYQVSLDAEGWPIEISVNQYFDDYGTVTLGTLTKIEYH